jgi:type IV pilus assembly protein PilA
LRRRPRRLLPVQPRSPQAFTGKEIVLILAFILGILAALAHTAYRKVRVSSEDKAVLCPIRQLAAAADQYYLENGVSSVRYEDLVGATNYVKAVTTIAGETYPALYVQGMTITVTGVAGVRTVTYAP